MRKILTSIFAFLLGLATPVFAQTPNSAPNPDLLTACTLSQFYDASTSGMTKLVSGTSTMRIYVCGFNFFSAGTANVDLVYGTGGTCGSGTTKVTPAFQFTAQTGDVDHLPVYGGLVPVPASNDLCINVSAGVAVQAIVYYAQF